MAASSRVPCIVTTGSTSPRRHSRKSAHGWLGGFSPCPWKCLHFEAPAERWGTVLDGFRRPGTQESSPVRPLARARLRFLSGARSGLGQVRTPTSTEPRKSRSAVR